ncbi:winged helix-turn-helix transcriptional regulator [Sphingobium mellinum]|uniref:winged helix-turn-helix transcriptional regulator n=1 Tax=Sphingobium mellinum TaxID=1387166 RepID=UPI0030ED99E2
MRRRAETDDPLLIAEDILSAKWTLPILRVLGGGPARFSGLRTAIPGVSANILAGRLRDLEEAGILGRTTLPPPADCQVYALTDIGEAARPILLAIARWATRLHGETEPLDKGQPQRSMK